MAYEPVGLVVGKFAPPHKGHQHLIETALGEMETVIILVYSNPDFPEMPVWERAAWVRESYPQAYVYIPENPPLDSADDHTQREFVRQWLQDHHHELPISKGWVDVVYSSEEYGEGFAKHVGASHRMVDLERKAHPITGTKVRKLMQEIREGSSYQQLADRVYLKHDLKQMEQLENYVGPRIRQRLERWLESVYKVVFLGAESTGKSTLTERMAKEFHTAFVSEYGREYYEQKGGVMEPEDYVNIAAHHRKLEDEALIQANAYLFVDTNAVTTMFFSHYYNQSSLPALQAMAKACKERYHYTFVCSDDIPFDQDGWRDNAVWRGRMQGMVLHDLEVRGIPYTIVWGSLEQRVKQVKAILDGEEIQSFSRTKQLGPKR